MKGTEEDGKIKREKRKQREISNIFSHGLEND
jgi:hypothetical protein